MINIPATPYDGVEETLQLLKEHFNLILLTKGHNTEQENKIHRSGLERYFDSYEVMYEKNEDAYRNILKKYNISAADFVMIGNSDKSDILPVINIGGQAIHIPSDYVWDHEVASEDAKQGKDYPVIGTFREIPATLQKMEFA